MLIWGGGSVSRADQTVKESKCCRVFICSQIFILLWAIVWSTQIQLREFFRHSAARVSYLKLVLWVLWWYWRTLPRLWTDFITRYQCMSVINQAQIRVHYGRAHVTLWLLRFCNGSLNIPERCYLCQIGRISSIINVSLIREASMKTASPSNDLQQAISSPADCVLWPA